MTGAAHYSRTPREGCCNQMSDRHLVFGLLYCNRPDNGSGMCNIHEAARENAARVRLENRARGPFDA